MGSLLKQLRVSFAGIDEDDEYNAERRQRKTGSSIRERKKKETWFSRQTSQSDYSSDGEYTSAIAAVAYAIKRLEEEEEQAAESVHFKNSVNESGELRNKTKNKMEESFSKPTDSKKMLRWLSGDDSLKNPSTSEKVAQEEITWERKISEKLPEKMPSAKSIKKTATFADKYPRKMDSRKYENEKDNKGGSKSSLPMEPQVPYTPFPKQPVASNRNNQMARGKFSSEADAWAKAEMEKIRKKYEKMNSTILEWENEKKMKAKRRLENKERELEERRARAVQEYRNELIRVDKISGGARALAEQRKRNDEAKTIEKANKIRATGKLPTACPCF